MKQINSNLTEGSMKKSQPQSIIITTIQQSQNETQKILLRSSPNIVIIKYVIQNIVALASEKLYQNRLTKKHLNNFSRQFVESYINQNIDMHMFNGQYKRLTNQQAQPINIKGDNLCPASTSVQQKLKSVDDVISLPGTIVNETVGRLTRNMSTVSRASRNTNKNNINSNRNQSNQSIKNSSSTKKAPKVYEFVKLNEDHLPKTEDSLLNNDPYVQQLRRIKQSKPKIQLKTKQEKKSNSLRQKIKLQDKFSYDFTGDILKINQKHQQKSTLLTAQIKTVQNQGLINRPYESFMKNTPTSIQNPNLKRDKAKKLPSTRQPDVEFSNVMSLVQNFQIKQGAKFIHNKATLEKKKKQPSLGDIKNSLSLNKISRSQFAKLKSIDSESIKINKTLLLKGSVSSSLHSLKNNIQPQQLTKIQNINDTYSFYNGKNKIHQSINSDRTQIRSLPKHTNMKKNNKLLHTQRSHQRVSVQNQQLSEMLVDDRFDIKVGDITSAKSQEQEKINKQNISNLQALSPRDKANLHYIKTGGTIGKLQLPKITYRLNDSSSSCKNQKFPNSILQSKSKIKGRHNQNEFQRLKKHFEDKLRV